MGLPMGFSSSVYDCSYNGITDSAKTEDSPQNPNPGNYRIVRSRQVGMFLIVELVYPNCTNYEGRKIMVYENCTLVDLLKQKLIDPHFSGSTEYLSPIARFEPTSRGWTYAYVFVDSISRMTVDYDLKITVK